MDGGPSSLRCVNTPADGASWHKGPENTKLRKDSGYSLLPWPPNSPDLNSIENLWATVKRGHRKMLETEQRPHIAQGLFEQAVLEWEKIPQETIDGSIKRMPGRIQAVLDAYQMVE